MNTLGLVSITTGGTPQALVPAATKTVGLRAGMVILTPKPANAGVVYVGKAGMVTGTGVNVGGAIPKPASATTGPFTPFILPPLTGQGGYNLNEIYIDGSTGDGVYVAYL